LTAKAHALGLADEHRYGRLQTKEQGIATAMAVLETTRMNDTTLIKWLRQPETTWHQVVEAAPALAELSGEVARQTTFDVKYSGYVARQAIEVDRQRRLAEKRIPSSFDYLSVRQLRTEAREKLLQIRPTSLAQASRISGITPADIALVMAYLRE
jgi:tRNA uridine 5-carboxymethylaminomethyl modification enzyme